MLPKEMDKPQMQIYDSVRFVIESIEYSYNKLVDILIACSVDKKRNVPAAFHYAWSVIDSTYRLKAICNLLPYEDNFKLIGNLNYVAEFRHAFQHIHERIPIISNEFQKSVFGTLCWIHCEDIKAKALTYNVTLSASLF